jgi:ribosomal protein L7Ae-like RNA K-turn-binding protein
MRMKRRRRTSEALALLGLARRAGAVVAGTEAVREALRKGSARLVILAEDMSGTQQEKVLPLVRARGVPWETLGSMQEVGDALGRGPLAAVAVTAEGFAGEIRKRLGRE